MYRIVALRTSRFEGERRELDWPLMLANSFLDGEDTVDLRNVFAMFESVGEHSKSQRLRFRDRFIAKGRFERRMDEIPVKLITHPQPGLYGAAAAFAREHR